MSDGARAAAEAALTDAEAEWLLHHGVDPGLSLHRAAGDVEQVTWLEGLRAKLAARLQGGAADGSELALHALDGERPEQEENGNGCHQGR